MPTATKPYTGIPGFNIGTPDVATPSPPERAPSNLAQLCRENDELIADLARYAENLVSEAAIRRKYRDLLNNEAWTTLGQDDLLVEMIEAEKVRRIRNGAAKREKAQNFVTAAPDVLNGIMSNPKESARHRIDASKVFEWTRRSRTRSRSRTRENLHQNRPRRRCTGKGDGEQSSRRFNNRSSAPAQYPETNRR